MIYRYSKEEVAALKADYPKGCQQPDGYVSWHRWATAQGFHGLKQEWCELCGLYLFPQEAHKHAG